MERRPHRRRPRPPPGGLARLQEAWPAHLASIRRHVLDNLTGHDLAALAAALERVAITP
ncbi:hypothetical protein OG318_04190 [Streptomyces sp. NBC_01483]|nr:hypothetical protein [Streptomyces sp. NBC_01483]